MLSKAEGKGRYGGGERVSISFLRLSNDNRQKVLRTGEERERGTVSRTRLWVCLGLLGIARPLPFVAGSVANCEELQRFQRELLPACLPHNLTKTN